MKYLLALTLVVLLANTAEARARGERNEDLVKSYFEERALADADAEADANDAEVDNDLEDKSQACLLCTLLVEAAQTDGADICDKDDTDYAGCQAFVAANKAAIEAGVAELRKAGEPDDVCVKVGICADD